MMRVASRAPWVRAVGVVAVILVTMILVAACGGGSSVSSSSGAGGPSTAQHSTAGSRTTIAHATHPPLPPPTRTACRSVVYIGDSTSEGETSAQYIPNPRRQLPAQLARVGVLTTFPEISGARSVVETFQGNANGATVAQEHMAQGFHGCWILALGTNDVADLGAGSTVGLTTRIARMMAIIGQQPVLWVNLITLLSSGYYAESAMQQWNRDLLRACHRYPNLRVYDWAAHAKLRWFIPDGIHYYSPGYVARSHDIARGLVKAFPEDRPASASCLVR